ncbi:MAG: ethanolamine utilization protein EutJ [Deltaproteobacteria bacterium]|nr:MAG: ethanolamine utilization protein EutJ [Deltaproteobacteria bacterium]
MHFITDPIEHLKKILNHPEGWNFTDAKELYAGVDLGTYKTIAIIIDEAGVPRAASMRKTEVARSGLIVDYVGALNTVHDLMEEIRKHCPIPIEKGATSYPPQTEYANLKTTTYILEGVGLEVLKVLDEPTAANQVLKIKNGAIVDVGGGTTGIAVIKNGTVVYTNDEATGGVHLSLVLAGNYKISYEKAEEIKTDKKKNREVLPIVRPVIEKISSIAATYLEEFDDLEKVCLVGGTCELEGFKEIVAQNIGLEAFRPRLPQFITPFGIALSCLDANEDSVRV